ncbi:MULTISPECIES: hypothetical protein [Clostridium]|uniref:Uncharacterized protein n=2 Tax=Clostridium TaxID=1485 RepID=A0A3R5U8F5_9CLOT|nr:MULTISPECIES: hypothetical protein [Clostridium]EKQ57672.1 MAG: hypothetical protein A370_00660 [Clostridium sp. Maddingley MBC34-26]OOP74371.1 hypothetical protein CBEIBR21_07750 [Clostridium beijerinckii]QAA31750.1 hypothetical protein C1I91_08870 [Clostridium manihotivorum]
MSKNHKKCSEETLISIVKDYIENAVFKKVKYTDLAEYAKEKGYESVERRDFSRNKNISNLINDINEKNLLSEKALKLENMPFKSFYIDIDFVEKINKNNRLQYLNYFNKAQTDIIKENEKLKKQISELKVFIDTLKTDKIVLANKLREKQSENRELKKLLIRENSKRDILYELELFEKLRGSLKVKNFAEHTYVDFYNKYWNEKQTDILDITDITNEKQNQENIRKLETEIYTSTKALLHENVKEAEDDSLNLPSYDDF